MGFISGIFDLLKKTTWPSRQQRWKDFLAVLQYTAFFTLVIFLFDQIISRGILAIINLF